MNRITLPAGFREKVLNEIKQRWNDYVTERGTDENGKSRAKQTSFCQKYKIDNTMFNTFINKNKPQWSEVALMDIGRHLGVVMQGKQWNIAKTVVFDYLYDDMATCQNLSINRICIDDCGMGKTQTATEFTRSRDNVLFVPCKQCKTHYEIISYMAKELGIVEQKYANLKSRIKSFLNTIEKPLIILDDLGYITDRAVQDVLELMESTEGYAGWYMIGDDSLQTKLENGVAYKKTGFRTLFSRLGKNYTTILDNPKVLNELGVTRSELLKSMIEDVIVSNMPAETTKQKIKELVLQSLESESKVVIGDLRRARAIVLLNQ